MRVANAIVINQSTTVVLPNNTLFSEIFGEAYFLSDNLEESLSDQESHTETTTEAGLSPLVLRFHETRRPRLR